MKMTPVRRGSVNYEDGWKTEGSQEWRGRRDRSVVCTITRIRRLNTQRRIQSCVCIIIVSVNCGVHTWWIGHRHVDSCHGKKKTITREAFVMFIQDYLIVQLFVHLITRCVRKHKIKSKYIFRINMFCNTFTKGSLQPWKFLYGFFKLFLMLSQFQSSLVLYVILAHYYQHTNTEDIRDDKKFSHLWGYSKPLHCCHCCLLIKQNWKMAMFVNCKVHSFDIRGCW